MLIDQIFHNLLHLMLPLAFAIFFYKHVWKKAYLIMLSAWLIDIDHLLADPVFDSSRCSIGFHPLHSYYAILIYFLLTLYPKTRIFGLGLLLHIFTDFTDCLRIYFI